MHVELYKQKLALFRKLAEISEKLADFSADDLMAENGALADLEAFLEKRDGLIEKIDALDKQLVGLAGEPSRAVKPLKGSLVKIAEDIRKNDAKAELSVKDGLKQLRRQRRKIQEGKQSSRAYGPRGDVHEGVFVDKRR
ncbi:MAG TPA: hypothetical protein GX528_05580 [Firmicutes bacterium]|nr:hypothetical protein [Bacillota bacterium]